jgi:hypothetical protein
MVTARVNQNELFLIRKLDLNFNPNSHYVHGIVLKCKCLSCFPELSGKLVFLDFCQLLIRRTLLT